MRNGAPQVRLNPDVLQRARAPIDRMLEWSAVPLANAG